MRISDWSSDVCSSDLRQAVRDEGRAHAVHDRVLAVDEGAVDVEDDEAVAEGECRHGRCLYHVGAACLSRFLPPESPGNLTDRHAPPPAPLAPRPPRTGRLRTGAGAGPPLPPPPRRPRLPVRGHPPRPRP